MERTAWLRCVSTVQFKQIKTLQSAQYISKGLLSPGLRQLEGPELDSVDFVSFQGLQLNTGMYSCVTVAHRHANSDNDDDDDDDDGNIIVIIS